MKEVTEEPPDLLKKKALIFIVLLGMVSLLADMTYEGARSITGPYLAILGSSALVVGLVAGLGELLGYSLRLLSGYLTDRTQKYWTLTIIGYVINLLAVPLLALAGSWQLAAVLIIAERMGKAIRTPPRDVMLSHATSSVGRGWGFGLHEAMDQIGAIAGPLLVAVILYWKGSYQASFAFLLLPAILALATLVISRFLYPHPHELEVGVPQLETKGFQRAYWIYMVAAALIAIGFADFPILAFHFQKTGVLSPSLIPIFYAVAMGVDALAALIFGRLFDRIGVSSVALATGLSSLFAPLVFLGGWEMALLGMVLWGVGMGAQESVMRAAIAELAPLKRRGVAYGLFNTIFGISWFVGSLLMGFLYDFNPGYLVVLSVVAQLMAIPFLIFTVKK
ncbi:MAG: MFS transporter [Methanobacteriaceae archaeon]|nr:MFS transporter [Methanobacteriaceae archaeon]